MFIRGCSSPGRATGSQSVGRRFESVQLHIMKKKTFLFIILFVFCFWGAFARHNRDKDAIAGEDTEIPIVYRQNVEINLNFNTMQGYEPSFFSVSGLYNITGKRFEAYSGIKLQYGDTQFTFCGEYLFFKRNKLSLGTGVIYNLNWLHNVSISNNFLPGFYLKWKPSPFFALDMNIDFFLKLRNVFALNDDLSSLVNTTLAFSFHNDFYLPNNINLYFEVASIEPFRYMILGAPSFIFGASYPVLKNLEIGMEASIHYIDFFTISAHFEDIEFSLEAVYRW